MSEMATKLTLLVLRCQNLERSKQFYDLLGLTFDAEQHGQGPRHYAAQVGDLVFEMYPVDANHTATAMRLGLRVAELDQSLSMLRDQGVRVIQEPKNTPWGRRAVVEDPDGNRVELM